MAKKKEEEKVKLDGWKDTFSDLMNLLLCFFVLLYASCTVDAEKFQEIAASFSNSFSVLDGGKEGIEDGMLIASGASQLNELSEYYTDLAEKSEDSGDDVVDNAQEILEQAEMEESEQMGDKIEDMLDKAGKEDAVEVQVTQHYVVLNMKGALLFETGSAELTTEAVSVLETVSSILKTYDDHTILIEGHTDNVPIHSGIYTSNDVLSDYRALAVFECLVDNGVSPKNMIHAGRGEYDPIASNDTAEGRAQNRRVTIKIYNSFSGYAD